MVVRVRVRVRVRVTVRVRVRLCVPAEGGGLVARTRGSWGGAPPASDMAARLTPFVFLAPVVSVFVLGIFLCLFLFCHLPGHF